MTHHLYFRMIHVQDVQVPFFTTLVQVQFVLHLFDVLVLYVAYHTRYIEQYQAQYQGPVPKVLLTIWKEVAEMTVLFILIKKGKL